MPDTRADLGQFFTPRPVIDFALSAIVGLGARPCGARVCDPACGPGEWLRAALDAGAREAVGIDCDPAMVAAWHRSNLGGDPRVVLAVADGLDPGMRLTARADFVLGNPPFGADLTDAGDASLAALAAHYRLPTLRRPMLPGTAACGAGLERLRRFPIELLFLERFVDLCRPGGWIAIILPEGVFSNSRWRHVRRWLLDEVTVHLVVALPQATFRAHATTARTCLALMQRERASANHEVRLCGVDDCSEETLTELLAQLRDGSSANTGQLDLTPPIFAD